MSVWCKACSTSIIVFLGAVNGIAQSFPTGFSRQVVNNSVVAPTAIAFTPDGRIFVTQQTGKVRIIKDGVLLTNPFLTLTVDNTGERGLIGMAFDPDFQNNNFIYLYYTVPGSPPHNRLSRFTANGDTVAVGSEFVLLELDPLSVATNHNGGALAFGNDGKLYVGVGENANGANSQNLTTYHGKILRMNTDGSVPEDNPFIAGSLHAKLIWALGMRNPFTIAVNNENGKIFVNDVGANLWEEINDISIGGKNFGWPTAEGNSTNPDFTNPVFSYPHGSGSGKGCAIAGGTFFYPTSTNYPSEYYGKYFFLDFCNLWINTIDAEVDPVTSSPFATAIGSLPLCFAVSPDGNLYYLSRAAVVYKIVYNDQSPPFITNNPLSVETLEGNEATFEVKAIGSIPFSYQWKKNNADIDGATGQSFLISAAAPEDDGDYTVVVSNSAGSVTSASASLMVTPVVGLNTSISEDQIVLFPNPVKNTEAFLKINATTLDNASIIMYDPLSNKSRQINAVLTQGMNQIELPTTELPNGVYVVSVKVNSKRNFLRLVIIN